MTEQERAATQMAIDIIEGDLIRNKGSFYALKAVETLRAALAVPDSEPAAYAIFAKNKLIRIWSTEDPHVRRIAKESGLQLVKLYAAPQPTLISAPVTDDEIDAAFFAANGATCHPAPHERTCMRRALEGFAAGRGAAATQENQAVTASAMTQPQIDSMMNNMAIYDGDYETAIVRATEKHHGIGL